MGELFAGISGFGLGFERAGIATRWRVEIDDAARSVLRYRYPDAPLLRDVRECGAHNLEPVHIITFGSPCQDLSVAGKRAGLAGQRSGLFYEAIRIVSELRPTFAVWENVGGAISSNGGRDFAAVIAAFHELGARDIAWTHLDAQYFGLAQRRYRVFVVADFRGERAGEILFERPCMCGHPPTRGEAGAGVAHSLTASIGGCSGKEQQPTFVGAGGEPLNAISPAVTSKWAKGSGGPAGDECQNLVIAHTLRAEGHDASEDGTGRGTPIVAIPILEAGARTGRSTDDSGCGIGIGEHGDPMFTLQSTKQHVVAFGWQNSSRQGLSHDEHTSPTIDCSKTPAVAFQTRIARNGRGQPKDICDALTSCEGGTHADSKPHVAGDFGVRRLTPRECERLQGFPDDWTRYGVTESGATIELKDSPRYRMLGNAVAVPVAEWIARRIVRVTEDT